MASTSIRSVANQRTRIPAIWRPHLEQRVDSKQRPFSPFVSSHRSFSVSLVVKAGGKNKIRVSNRGKFKEHRLGGPGLEEVFDIERDLAKPFAMQDVPGVTHLLWAEARKRLNKLRAIKFQMPSLIKYQQPFVPPISDAHVIVKTHDDLGFDSGKLDSQRPNRKVTIQVNLSKVPELNASPEAMHKIKLLSGKRWFAPEPRSEFDTNDHYDDPHGMIKIACDDYSNRQMNEKWCSDTLDRLIKEATNLDLDSMKDIPLDHKPTIQRRHRKKNKPWSCNPELNTKFPKDWLPEPIQDRLNLSQKVKKNILFDQKKLMSQTDQQIRELIKWDGIGLTPIGIFDQLNQDAKDRLQQLVNERNRIRDLSSHLDRNFLKNFQPDQTPPQPVSS